MNYLLNDDFSDYDIDFSVELYVALECNLLLY